MWYFTIYAKSEILPFMITADAGTVNMFTQLIMNPR